MNSLSSSHDDRIGQEQKLKQTTLVYVFNPQGQVLLAVKKNTKSGFNVALEKVNAAGGKQKEGETNPQAAIRELEKEFGVVAEEDQLVNVGKIRFIFETKSDWSNECHVYKILNYTGTYKIKDDAGDEMKHLKYFDIHNLPRDKMRESDTYRMPKMLRGELLDETFNHTDDGKVILTKN